MKGRTLARGPSSGLAPWIIGLIRESYITLLLE